MLRRRQPCQPAPARPAATAAALPPPMHSGVAFEVTAIGNVEGEPGLGSLPAALIGWTNCVAANLCFFPAGIIQVGAPVGLCGRHEGGGVPVACSAPTPASLSLRRASPPQMVEAANMDWDRRQRAWAASGRRRPRPRRRLLPTRHDLRTVSWWAALVQLSGMMGFNIATISLLLCYAVEMQARQHALRGRQRCRRCACCATSPAAAACCPRGSHLTLCLRAGHGEDVACCVLLHLRRGSLHRVGRPLCLGGDGQLVARPDPHPLLRPWVDIVAGTHGSRPGRRRPWRRQQQGSPRMALTAPVPSLSIASDRVLERARLRGIPHRRRSQLRDSLQASPAPACPWG